MVGLKNSGALSVQRIFEVVECWVIISSVNWWTVSKTCVPSLMKFS